MNHRRSTWSARAAAAGWAALLGATTTASALTVSIADMNAADWASVSVTQNASVTLVLSTPDLGGNSGSFWRHDFAVPSLAPAVTAVERRANIYQAASYDPGAEGELGELTLSFDVIRLASSFANGSAGFLLAAVEQDGRIFIQSEVPAPVQNLDWSRLTFSSADADDWIELGTNAHPDFSAAGGILHFGYRLSAGATCPGTALGGCLGVAAAAGLDNFSITALPRAIVTPVPEPQSLALALVALALLSTQARARRRAGA